MSALIEILSATVGTLGFAFVFNIRGKKIVFAALGGMLLLHERMRVQGYIGCVLIFAGILVSQWVSKKQPQT